MGGGNQSPWGPLLHQPWPANRSWPRGWGGVPDIKDIIASSFRVTIGPAAREAAAELSLQPVLEPPHLALVGVAIEGDSNVQVLKLLLELGRDLPALSGGPGHGGEAIEVTDDGLPQGPKGETVGLSEQTGG